MMQFEIQVVTVQYILANIFQRRIEYELIYSLRGAKQQMNPGLEPRNTTFTGLTK